MEETYKRQPEQEQKAKKDNIHVKTCIDPVAVKTYEDLKALLETKYPGRFTYSHEIYPLPFWRDIVSRMCNAIFALFCLILVAILIIPKTPYSYLISKEFLAMFREKKFYIMGVVAVLNYLCEYLQKSGAFEIYFNDKLVSSKLASGDYPEEETITNFIDKQE